MTQDETQYEAIARRVRRNHNRARMIECIVLVAFLAALAGSALWYTRVHSWDTTGTALLVSAAPALGLTLWLVTRSIMHASPILTEEDYIKDRITEELQAARLSTKKHR